MYKRHGIALRAIPKGKKKRTRPNGHAITYRMMTYGHTSGELDLGSAASLQTLVLREGAILAHQGNNIEMSNDYIPVFAYK